MGETLSVCTRGGDGGFGGGRGGSNCSDFAENEDTQATSGPKVQSSAQPGLTPCGRETLRQAGWRLLTPGLRPWLPGVATHTVNAGSPCRKHRDCLYSGTFSSSQQEQFWDHQVLESQAGCTGP